MRTYTSVMLDADELDALRRVGPSLHLACPRMDEELPGKHMDAAIKANPDLRARSVLNLLRDPSAGTHETMARALWAVERLVEVAEREASLDWWLDLHEQETGQRVEPSDAPTSPYAQYRVLADIRGVQLREARPALAILSQAARLCSPRPALNNLPA